MFFKSTKNELLADVTIPSLFFDMYIPIASGNQIKVFLMGYKEAFFNDYLTKVDNSTISNNLGITKEEIDEAWSFWEMMGVVKIHDKNNKYLIEFLDIKQEYLKNKYEIDFDKEENSEDVVDEDFNYFDEVEKISQRLLTPNEKLDILEAMKNYNISPEMLIAAFESAVGDTGRIKSVNYVISIMKSWFDDSIDSIEKLDFKKEDRRERRGIYKLILNNLGIYNRMSTKPEEKIIDKWLDEFDMNPEMLELACSKSINAANPTIVYINGIIEKWYKKGIKTPEQAHEDDRRFNEEKQKRSTKPKSGKENTAKVETKFHNFNSRITKQYTSKELMEIAKKNR